MKFVINNGWKTTCRIAISLLMAFIMAASTAHVLAQTETGQIVGEVRDATGAVIPGATVVLRSTTRGTERRTTTNENGTYVIANLQPDVYDVTAEASGFAPGTQRVQVTVGSRVSANIELAAQAITEQVTVVGGQGVEVNTETQTLSTTVTETQMRELPTITRNPYSLVQLSGNISPGDPSDPAGAAGRGVGFAINGQRAASTNILLDGGENNDQFTATVGQSVPLDSVQEFRVLTSNYTAEYGRATGGIVNVATRAGSNEFHGTLYEFNRNSALATNSYENNAQGVEKGVFNRNQFGYSVGGPIFRDRLFFFSSTEWTRVRSNENTIVLVPTPQLIAASAPATQNFFNQFQLKTPINGRIFTVGDIGGFGGLPAGLPAFGQVIVSQPTDVGAGFPQNSWQTVGRIDYTLSDRMTLYGRFAIEDQSFFEGTNAFSPFVGFDTGVETFNQNHLISLTNTWSPTMVSQFKIVYNRLNQQQPLGANAPGPTLYFFANAVARIEGFPIALPGYLPFNPGSAIPFGGPQNLTQFYADNSKTWREHNFRFGGTYIYIQDNRTFGAFQNAVEVLGSSLSQGLENLVAGELLSFQAAVNPQGRFPGETITLPAGPPNFSRSNRYHEFAFYLQDTWRVRPNLTLDLGLRYDYFGVQRNKDESLDANFYYGPGNNFFEQIRNGRVFIAPESPVGALWEPDKNNFAPRLGFAWDIFGDGSTSFRGGYGISYERNFGNVTFNVIQNPPNYAVVSLVSGVDVPTLPITLSNVGPLAGTGTAVLPRTSLRHVDQNIVNAMGQFWSLALQRELWGRSVFSIEYSGSRGDDLYSLTDPNRPGAGAIYLGDAEPLARLNSQFSNLNTRGNLGFSRYHALNLGYETPFLRDLGLHFTARYTWSHAIDNLSSTFSESANNFNLGLLDPFNPELDRGDADFDVRHRFVTSWVWEIPYYRDSQRLFGQFLGGWSITGIFTAQTGTPFTVFDCTNGLVACIRAVQIGTQAAEGPNDPPEVADVPNRFRYIDFTGLAEGIYVNPVTGTSDFGPFPSNMTGRNAFRSPGFWNLDAGLYKSFRITEGTALQLRFEAYNVFNHANLFVLGSQAFVDNGLGYVPARRLGRRNIQLAAKFIF